jgi:hypothetical protein
MPQYSKFPPPPELPGPVNDGPPAGRNIVKNQKIGKKLYKITK